MTTPVQGERIAESAATVAALGTRPLSSLTGAQLDALESSASGVMFAAWREVKRRQEMPRDAAQLRLVAVDGELTDAGTRRVRALKAARTRAINHNSRKGIS